ncbi:MAG: hypothetical protein IJ572_03230 [Bacilli bacterium]|nr:hypothetical protein [Bacilli bacterium]
MEKKNVVFLTVLAIATLLTAIVGTTFAFFTASVSTPNTVYSTEITTANNLGITYEDGANVTTGTAITPGWFATKTVSVTNNSSTNSIDYQIAWTSVANNFAKGTNGTEDVADDTDDFVYSIVKTVKKNSTVTTAAADYLTSGANTKVYAEADSSKSHSTEVGKATTNGTNSYFVKAMPSASNELLVSQTTIGPGETHEYEITFMFLETGIAQNENGVGKSFSGTLGASIVSADGIRQN